MGKMIIGYQIVFIYDKIDRRISICIILAQCVNLYVSRYNKTDSDNKLTNI